MTYQFEPGTDADGVTVHVPLQVLNQVTGEGFDWQIPGLRQDLVTELIRSLPKAIRRHYVPAPDHAREFLLRAPRRSPSRWCGRWRGSCSGWSGCPWRPRTSIRPRCPTI